jgi:glycosyltransferase involved in cell wall biosynthesis
MNNPLISIIIPTYNRNNLLKFTLNSILIQTYSNFEVIIVDDGSVLPFDKEYLKIDKRLKYFYKLNEGVAASRNFGLSLAGGDFIAFLDDDDTYEQDFLNKMVSNLTSNMNFKVAYCKGKLIDINNNFIRYLSIGGKSGRIEKEFLLKKILVYIPCCLFSKDTFTYVKRFEKGRNPEDYAFLLEMTLRFDFLFVDDYLVNIRSHDISNQRSSIDTKDKIISYGITHIDEIEKQIKNKQYRKTVKKAIALWYNYLSFHLLQMCYYKESFYYASKGINTYPLKFQLYHKYFFSLFGILGCGWLFIFVRNIIKMIIPSFMRVYLHRKLD